MTRHGFGWSGAVVALLWSFGAGAVDERPPPEPDPDADGPGEGDRTYSHAGQFGIRGAVAGGLRMVFRYDTSPYCKEPEPDKPPKEQQKFCGHSMPLAMDFGLSFAPMKGFEPFLWGRFGLAGEPQTNTHPVQIVGAGARLYTMADDAFKFYIQPALGWEFDQGAGNVRWTTPAVGYEPSWQNDLIVHLAFGPQLDLAQNFGLYVQGAFTVGVFRAIHSSVELGGGLQLRAP